MKTRTAIVAAMVGSLVLTNGGTLLGATEADKEISAPASAPAARPVPPATVATPEVPPRVVTLAVPATQPAPPQDPKRSSYAERLRLRQEAARQRLSQQPNQSFTLGDYTYSTNAAGQAAITGFNKNYTGAPAITNTLGRCPVTSIEDSAFLSCTNLTGVTIPSSVTTIGYRALFYLKAITVDPANENYSSQDGVLFNKRQTTLIRCPLGKEGNYAIPASVTSIIGNAFHQCTGLTGVTIPAGVTAISPDTFYGCAGLKAITVDAANAKYSSLDGVLFNKDQTTLILCPDGKTGNYAIPASVTRIGNGAFSNCAVLTNITIPSGVTNIGNATFRGCTGLANVSIPVGVTSIGSMAFYDCTGLTNITIPGSVTRIGDYAFQNCTNIPTSILILEGLMPPTGVALGDYFYKTNAVGQAAITGFNRNYRGALTITNTLGECPVTTIGGTFQRRGNYNHDIGGTAFYGCIGLTSITLPFGATSIRNYAFLNCTGLTNIAISATVTNIQNEVFNGCSGLKVITVDAANENYSNLDGVLFDRDRTTLILCPNGKAGNYAIPAGVTNIAKEAFYYCANLTSVTIPASVTGFEFENSGWSWYTAHDKFPFVRCTALTNITVDAANETFSSSDGVVYNKDRSTLIRWPKGKKGTYAISSNVTNMEYAALDGCTGLTNVTISTAVTNFKHQVLWRAVNLMAFNVDSNNATYSSNEGVLFDNNQSTLIDCPVGKAGGYAIPSGVTSIGEQAFLYCARLSSVIIPASVNNIGDQAFYCCTGLTNIIVPASVTNIGYDAFAGCTNLPASIQHLAPKRPIPTVRPTLPGVIGARKPSGPQ